jgi:hypothetical protein
VPEPIDGQPYFQWAKNRDAYSLRSLRLWIADVLWHATEADRKRRLPVSLFRKAQPATGVVLILFCDEHASTTSLSTRPHFADSARPPLRRI